MRSTYSIETVLGSRGKIAVLRTLRGVSVPLTAARVAAASGISKPAAATILAEFTAMGLVASSLAGRSWVYWLVRANVYVETIVDPIFRAEEEVVERLPDELRTVFQHVAESVVLFGSYARGDQDPQSDIDVLLVAANPSSKPILERVADDHAAEFRSRYGASLSPIIYDAGEAAALRKRSPALADSLERDGVVVHGSSPWEWGADAEG